MTSAPPPATPRNQRPPRRNWHAGLRPHWIEIILALGLLVIGAGQIYVYLRQVAIMEVQANLSDSANQTNIATQRAFVVVNGLEIKRGDDDVWNITPIIKNSGNTPTKGMIYTGIFVQLLGERGPIFNNNIVLPNTPGDPASVFYELGFHDDGQGLVVLGPQAVLPFSPSKQILSQSMIDRMKNLGYTKFIGSGAIVYSDIFPHSKRHITKYCYTATTEGVDGVCGHWNCADDECKADAEAYNKAVTAAFEKVGRSANPGFLARVDFP